MLYSTRHVRRAIDGKPAEVYQRDLTQFRKVANLMSESACRIYLITPPALADLDGFADTLARTLDAGDVAALQIRLKDADDDTVRRTIDALRPIGQDRDVAVIVNDRPDLAAETGCDGVHIGQKDSTYKNARALVGPDAIIGVTCHDSRHFAMLAAENGADYVAFGAFFPTETKVAPAMADIDLLTWWQATMTTPCVAIGGITPDNAAAVAQAGADFVAICGGVWNWAAGPEDAVKRLTEMMPVRED